MDKYDKIELIRAYVGCAIITHWIIWSNINYGVWGTEPMTYLTTLGGLL